MVLFSDLLELRYSMKLLLISYGSVEYDGRLRGLIAVFNQLGELHTFTRGKTPLTEYGTICNNAYFTFIFNAVCYARQLDAIDLLILDNRKATISGLLIKALQQPAYIVQDCRELYLFNEIKYFTGKIGCCFEKIMAHKADIVICANRERAKIMKRVFSLAKEPLVYTNIRQLNYTTDEEKDKAYKKLCSLLKENEYRIISLSGCSINRTTDVLVKNLKKVNKKCRLFLVGNNMPTEVNVMKDLAALDTKNEVTILGWLNQSELKYLVSHCHIGIVNYGQYDKNNKYCASGKLYEYLFEGIPVVTTTNPPLKQICDEEGIGVADDQFADGINEVLSNYEAYKERVKAYTKRISVAENDNKLIREIEMILNR